jgi:hypothetical protein
MLADVKHEFDNYSKYDFPEILAELDDGVLVVTLNRPKK